MTYELSQLVNLSTTKVTSTANREYFKSINPFRGRFFGEGVLCGAVLINKKSLNWANVIKQTATISC